MLCCQKFIHQARAISIQIHHLLFISKVEEEKITILALNQETFRNLPFWALVRCFLSVSHPQQIISETSLSQNATIFVKLLSFEITDDEDWWKSPRRNFVQKLCKFPLRCNKMSPMLCQCVHFTFHVKRKLFSNYHKCA